ncbi:MAG: SAM-dependent methyltransferase [Thermoguttaceae bacterium]|nr:SAM-dependent methyltransferase [Thermoguttaceae bacterium]MDW8079848.1 SAM-dependent methyltransferase [Thermoguttaceae bacterium]
MQDSLRHSARNHHATRRAFLVRFLGLVTVSVISAPSLAEPSRTGTLYLVGVGPGDADMMTIRAARTIEKAEIVYVSPGVAERLREYLAGKQVIEGYWQLFWYYGMKPEEVPPGEKEAFERITAQRSQFIAQVRSQLAQGKTVAILDNGDALVYGPWAWILEEFSDVNPVVIPGVSAFNAAHAALRKSPTISPRTKSVILTANDWPGKTDTIPELARLGVPMAIFTMRAEFESFIEKLRTSLPDSTPVAVVEHAGYKDKERVILGTLGDITQKVSGNQLAFEYLIYVGDFITYRQKK